MEAVTVKCVCVLMKSVSAVQSQRLSVVMCKEVQSQHYQHMTCIPGTTAFCSSPPSSNGCGGQDDDDDDDEVVIF